MTTDNRGDQAAVSKLEGVLQEDFDWERTAPSTAVVELVSRVLAVEPTAIEPLYGAVDPDALDRLVNTDRAGRAPIRIEFGYEGLDVMVESGGTVAVRTDPVFT